MTQQPTPLPDPDRHRLRVMAAIDHLESTRSRRYPRAVPALATAAVMVAGAVGFVALDDGGGSARPAPGPMGQSSSAGVAKEHAQPGDPVPMDVARQALHTCLGYADDAVQGPPPPTFPNEAKPTATPTGAPAAPPVNVPSGKPAGAPPAGEVLSAPRQAAETPPDLTAETVAPPVSGAPGAEGGAPGASVPPPPTYESPRLPKWEPSPPDSTGIEGNNYGGMPRLRNLLWGGHGPWDLPEPASSYRPFFTAWESDGKGGLNVFLLAKADGPGLLLCRGPDSRPWAPAMIARTPWLFEPIEAERMKVSGPMDQDLKFPLLADTNWGRATPDVARVTVTYPGGVVVEAAVRDGIWLASTPAAVFADRDKVRDEVPLVTAYDAAGKVLYEIPDLSPASCYRLPDNNLLAYEYEATAKPDPATCETAYAWTGTSG